MFFVKNVSPRLLIGWGLGFAASVLGLWASAKWDLPTGASVVTVFGVILILCAATKYFHRPPALKQTYGQYPPAGLT
jgi:ABC-type Mn2+/Zn2+ transport system permease subunit